MLIKNLTLLLLLTCFTQNGLNAQNRIYSLLENSGFPKDTYAQSVMKKKSTSDSKVIVKDALHFELNKDLIAQIISQKPNFLKLSIPYGNEGKSFIVNLLAKDPYTKNFKIETSLQKNVEAPLASFYRGVVENDPNSLVALSFFEGEMSGIISTSQNSQFDIGKLTDSDDHVIYEANNILEKPVFECHTSDENVKAEELNGLQSSERDAGDCVQIWIDADNELFNNKGSLTATINYVNGFFNVVSTIYENEQLTVVISQLFVWETPDPFPTNDSEDVLDFYTDFRDQFNGDLAALVGLGGNNLGGIAWLNVLCQGSNRNSFSDINANFNNYPNYSWTVGVVTHELGHNIGSPHTHSCSWPGGAIDNCFETEGTCNPGPAPTNGGTLMSYCHLSSTGINLANGFGPLPGNRIRSRVAASNCLSVCNNPDCGTIFVTAQSIVHPSCNNSSNGSITQNTPTGGIAPYTYTWSNGKTTKDITGLLAGTYTVTIFDANFCSGIATYTLNNPLPIVINEVVNDVRCNGQNDGSIILDIENGNGPFIINWSNGSHNNPLTSLREGNYTVTVISNNNCTATETFTVFQPDVIEVIENVTNISCFGGNNGAIFLSIYGGVNPYNVNWSNGSVGANNPNLTSGYYDVTIIDANLCKYTSTYFVFEPNELSGTLSLHHVTSPGGNDGSVTVNMQGGTSPYQYKFSNSASSNPLNGLVAGNYSVTVTDAKGCKKTLPFTITEPQCSMTAVVSTTNISCFGLSNGSAQVNVNANIGVPSILWSNGSNSANINNLSPGNYSVTITDNNCAIVRQINITQPNAIGLNLSVNNALCSTNNGSITTTIFNTQGNVNFLWSNGTSLNSLTNVGAGEYSLTITDQAGCSISASATVISIDNEAPELINNQISASLNQNGITNIQNIVGNLFQDNCNLFEVDLGPNTIMDCSDIGTQTISVSATDSEGNSATYAITITIQDQIVPSIQCPNNISQGLCQGGIISWPDITATDNCSIQGITQIAGLPSGSTFPEGSTINTFLVNDIAGNSSSCSFDVNIIPGLFLSSEVSHIKCNGLNNGSINVITTGVTEPYTIVWNNGATQNEITNLSPGVYSITVTDGFGCKFENSYEIVEPQIISFQIDSIRSASGVANDDGAIFITPLGGVGNYVYEWRQNNIVISNDEDLIGLLPGKYQVSVKDQNGCTIIGQEIIVQYTIETSKSPFISLLLYPNPTLGNVILQGESDILSKVQIEVYNISGKKINYESKYNRTQQTIQLGNQPNGVYCIKVMLDGYSKNYLVVKAE